MAKLMTASVAFAAGAALGWYLNSPSYSFRNRVVLITGGSRGLGLLLARELALEGARVAILARDSTELEKATLEISSRGGEVYALVCDVREATQAGNAVAKVVGQFGRVDVLINNAGVVQVGPMDNMSIRDYEEAMAVHFWAALHMIHAVLPQFRRRQQGRIVNIASIGGEVGVPHLSPYCASKYALVGLSDSLRGELAAEGIRVTTICPWLTRTGSYPHATFRGQAQKESAWFRAADSIPGISMNARRAARQIIEACRAGKARVTLGVPGKLAVLLNSLAPSLISTGQSIAGRLLPRPGQSSAGRLGWEVGASTNPG